MRPGQSEGRVGGGRPSTPVQRGQQYMHYKGRSPVRGRARPYERSRCAEHGELCHRAIRGVHAPPGIVILAPPEVSLSYARVLGGEALIQNLIERVIQGILVNLCRIIYLLLELSWAACANGIRYVVCEGAFQFELALRVELLQQLGLAINPFIAVESLVQLSLAFYSFVGEWHRALFP